MKTFIFINCKILLLLLSLLPLAIVTGGCSEDDGIKPANNEIVKTTHLEAVDLGLSVDWANCNIGAMSPSEFGGHYCWGDPTGLERAYTIENMPSSICDTQNDIVAANFGKGWRLPTSSEINELVSKCKSSKVTINGTTGNKLTGPSGQSIFLPFAGYIYGNSDVIIGDNICGMYWAGEGNPSKLFAYYIYLGGQKLPAYGNISYSVSVRAVREKDNSSNSQGDKGNDDNKGDDKNDSSDYEKPETGYYDYTPTNSSMTVKYKIYNNDKAKVQSARIYYRYDRTKYTYVEAEVSGVYITARLKGLKKNTTYFVYCKATGKGGSANSEVTQLKTLDQQ